MLIIIFVFAILAIALFQSLLDQILPRGAQWVILIVGMIWLLSLISSA